MPRRRKVVHGAACPTCRAELRFYTDVILGATYEQCTNTRCANAVPHRPRPDPDAGRLMARRRAKAGTPS